MKSLFLALAVFICTVAAAQSKSVSAVLNAYYKLKNELVAGNSSVSAAAAAELKSAIEAVNNSNASAAEVKAFDPVKQKLQADASSVAASNDINKQRELFSSMSNNMISLAKAIKMSDQEIYVDYCSMKKSYWLSADKAIRNPYYGNKMLTCGNVKETIKQ
ncbi:DUF3347 domain-containing protein [Lacibacter sp. H375]|uniref:DUF3347 domain-containing protein n=1 Tax=Lacibacter sp. H375 TaxID=3133424 RepID=UPI0030C30C6F